MLKIIHSNGKILFLIPHYIRMLAIINLVCSHSFPLERILKPQLVCLTLFHPGVEGGGYKDLQLRKIVQYS